VLQNDLDVGGWVFDGRRELLIVFDRRPSKKIVVSTDALEH
jgi:hypothetical protein